MRLNFPAKQGSRRMALAVSRRLLILGLLLGLAAITVSITPPAAEAGSPKTRTVDFNREGRAILAKNWFACHGQDEAKRAKGLRLDLREGAVKPLKSGETAIVPGDPD